MKALSLCLILLFISAALAFKKKPGAPPPKSPSDIYEEEECLEYISFCRASDAYITCERTHGCVVNELAPNDIKMNSKCKKAAIQCVGIMNECLDTKYLPGCSASGYTVPSLRPLDTNEIP